MGVFDGGTFCVTVFRKGDEDGEDEFTDSPDERVEALRSDPDVVAVETRTVLYTTGAYRPDLSFDNRDDEDEAG
ncbi:hypothetical protein [Streptomyces sp. NPDC002491]